MMTMLLFWNSMVIIFLGLKGKNFFTFNPKKPFSGGIIY